MKKSIERMYVESLESTMNHIKLPEGQKQINKKTDREYKKLNQLILVGKQRELNSKSNEWLSKDDLTEMKLQPKECQFGTQLYSYKIKEAEGKKEKVYSYYLVYNIEQLEEAK